MVSYKEESRSWFVTTWVWGAVKMDILDVETSTETAGPSVWVN